MPYLQNTTHEGFIFNEATKAQFLGNGVHAAMAMRYFVANLPTGQLDGNNQPIYANYNIGKAVGLYSSNGTGANLTEIYLDPVKLAITATETELSNVTVWSANSILTQGRGDARYQPVGSYLTSANLTWSNITGKPTFATVATSGSYTDLANTPNLSLYLTTANAATTYLPIANFTYSNITGKPTLANVATSGNYNDLSNKPASYTLPAATNSTLGGIIVGANLSVSANGTLSANIPTGGGGGFANGDILNGGTF